MTWQPSIPDPPPAIVDLADDRLRRRATDAWNAGYTLLAAIADVIDWLTFPVSQGMERGDEILKAGKAAINTLYALDVQCDIFRKKDDTPEHRGPNYWWPPVPSEGLPGWYDDIDQQTRRWLDERGFYLRHMLQPATVDWLGVLAMSPATAMEQTAASEPLGERQNEVASFIRQRGFAAGKEIATHFGVHESTVRSRYIPALKEHGLLNKKGRGYYFPGAEQAT